MEISGSTKITGLLGYPVEHSLSPIMHNAAFEALGLDYCYVVFPVHPDLLEWAVKAIKSLNLSGVNVTVPHKEKVIPFLDEVSQEATFIGAVNTIVNFNGRLAGYNTDGRGFMQSLDETGITVKDKNVLLIGAGGASRAISYYIAQKAERLFLFDIVKERLERLILDLTKVLTSINVMAVDDISRIERYHVIINATPLGWKEEDPLPCNTTLLTSDHVVCDLVYKKTRLLKEASQKGCVTLDGLGMLLWQGALAFELWTGKKPPIDVMRDALHKRLK